MADGGGGGCPRKPQGYTATRSASNTMFAMPAATVTASPSRVFPQSQKSSGIHIAGYGNKLNLTFEEIDSIIQQGKEPGVYMYIYTGGEPLVRKKDLIRVCEKHEDCIFLYFTNATLIDEAFADEMLRVKTLSPLLYSRSG